MYAYSGYASPSSVLLISLSKSGKSSFFFWSIYKSLGSSIMKKSGRISDIMSTAVI